MAARAPGRTVAATSSRQKACVRARIAASSSPARLATALSMAASIRAKPSW